MTAKRFSEQPDRPLILVIDDDPVIRRLIRFSMERDGYEVTEAVNGQEGLEVYQRRIPDIILLDFMMPVMNGVEFCHQLKLLQHQIPLKQKLLSPSSSLTLIETDRFNRQQYQFPDVDLSKDLSIYRESEELLSTIARTPILIITALEDDNSVTQAFEAGATDFITKPINWSILRQRVRHLINQAKLYQRLEATNIQLQKLAALDPLTQLANRRVFDLVFERQWRLMIRNQTPLSIIFTDIDYFKNYNDTYGHQAGDHCLFEVAQAIAAQVRRPMDLIARYGGEEIIIILPDTPPHGAQLIAANILDGVRSLAIPHAKSTAADHVTVSLGVVSLQPDHQSSPEELLAIADEALYEAKAQGRNQMIFKAIPPAQLPDKWQHNRSQQD